MNLGSPDSPSTPHVRKYLRQFLMDGRVIDIPVVSRFFLVNGVIAPFRAPKSAKLYSGIWSETEGSPLIMHCRRLRDLLRRQLGPQTPVTIAMRYGKPSIAQAYAEMEQAGVDEVILIPLYPHYAMSSYETAVVDAMDNYRKKHYPFQVKTVRAYYDDPRFLDVLADSIRPYLTEPFDHVLFSYHGIPERQVIKVDPTGSHCLKTPDCCTTPSIAHKTCYRHQCFFTTKELMQRLGLTPDQASTSFQSRLGRSPWLQPYTAELLPKLPSMGVRRLVMVSPAFSADCLETLEELDVEGKHFFMDGGGESFTRVPCLNTDPAWVSVVKGWIDGVMVGDTAMLETKFA